MYCRNCGKEIPGEAEICLNCGVRPPRGSKYCQNCGAETRAEAEICVKCGVKVVSGEEERKGKDFMTALLLSILVGELGVDRFYLGYTGLGILKLVTLGGCGVWYVIDVILIATKKLKDSEGRPLVGK